DRRHGRIARVLLNGRLDEQWVTPAERRAGAEKPVDAVGDMVDGHDERMAARRSVRVEDQEMARLDDQATAVGFGALHGCPLSAGPLGSAGFGCKRNASRV